MFALLFINAAGVWLSFKKDEEECEDRHFEKHLNELASGVAGKRWPLAQAQPRVARAALRGGRQEAGAACSLVARRREQVAGRTLEADLSLRNAKSHKQSQTVVLDLYGGEAGAGEVYYQR
jgi:hypothetical protein